MIRNLHCCVCPEENTRTMKNNCCPKFSVGHYIYLSSHVCQKCSYTHTTALLHVCRGVLFDTWTFCIIPRIHPLIWNAEFLIYRVISVSYSSVSFILFICLTRLSHEKIVPKLYRVIENNYGISLSNVLVNLRCYQDICI